MRYLFCFLLVIILAICFVFSFPFLINREKDSFFDDLNIKNKDEIIDFVKRNTPLSSGYGNGSRFYKYKKYGVLVTKKQSKLFEIKIIKYLNKHNIKKNLKKYDGFFKYNDDFYIVSEYISGDYITEKKLDYDYIMQFIDLFFKMDIILLYNQDLSPKNILIDDDDLYLIDFDVINIIDENGNFLQPNFASDFCYHPDKCLINYLQKDYNYVNNENPYYDIFLPIPSNLNNFEYRTVSEILNRLRRDHNRNLFPFFNVYLKGKASYHKKRYNELKKIFNDLDKYNILNKERLKRGLEIEKAMSKVLAIENNYINKIEYYKIMIKFFSFLYCHSELKGSALERQKKISEKRINEFLANIDLQLNNLKQTAIENKDIDLYVQAQSEWVDYWKNYKNEKSYPPIQ